LENFGDELISLLEIVKKAKLDKEAKNDFLTVFNKMENLYLETMKIRALIKDAVFYKVIQTKSDGYIYHTKTSSMMGKNVADCIEYLKNPLHDDVLSDIAARVEKTWQK
jgi:hypothetical protein